MIRELTEPHVKLKGVDWFSYMFPALWLSFVALMTGGLAVGAYWGDMPRRALPLLLFMSAGFGVLALSAQWKLRRDLRFRRLETALTSEQSYARVLAMTESQRWRLGGHRPAVFLVYYTRASWFSWGERVCVQFRPNEILVSTICDPDKWPAVFGGMKEMSRMSDGP